jgi:hypothetical protein
MRLAHAAVAESINGAVVPDPAEKIVNEILYFIQQ